MSLTIIFEIFKRHIRKGTMASLDATSMGPLGVLED